MQDRSLGSSSHPVVLVTCDLEHAESPFEDRYHVRCAYARALSQAGAVPLLVTHSAEVTRHLGELCDGVLFTGSAPGALRSSARGEFETGLVETALSLELPVLGVCHGMQIIGQVLGAELGDVATEAVAHNPATGPEQLAHAVDLQEGTLLRMLAGPREAHANSMHSQALEGTGRFTIAARAPDGVIEAIEGHGPGFCMGVQWHPEYGLTETDRRIFVAFVAACAARESLRHRTGS